MGHMGHMTPDKTRKVHDHGGSRVVSLPTEVRESLDVELGDTVLWRITDGEVRLHKATIGVAGENNGAD